MSQKVSSVVAIDELQSLLGGRVILPGRAGYDDRRTAFYGGFDRHPAAIVRAATAQDVQKTVVFSRTHGLDLAIRGGGHSVAGHSTTEGGILLDLSGMRALEIDSNARTAWAEPGLTAGEYTNQTLERGLVTGFGDTSTVGIAGITLGGGVGYLSRKFGLTIDSLVAADVVTADGQLRRVDAQNHPGLFWALRGGGGNFGVATRLQFRLHELGQVFGGMLVLPATPKALAGLVAAAESAPAELSVIANVIAPAPPLPFLPTEHHGKKVIMAAIVYAGPLDAAPAALAPFRALEQPLADMLRPMSYREIFPPEDPSYHPVGISRNLFMDRFDLAHAERIVDALDRSTAALRACQIRVLGGAVSRVPDEATAYAFRRRPIMVNVAALCGPEGVTPEHREWVTALADSLRGSDRSAYVNFVGDEGPERVRDVYPGATWDRLASIKARYDPGNLFRLNQNVAPNANSAAKRSAAATKG